MTPRAPRKIHWPDVPFSPRRAPFYYGWVMVAGGVMAVLASIPGQTMGVGVFTESLVAAWGLERLQLSLAYMFGTILSSFLLPFAGQALDRVGARAMIVASALGLGLSLVFMASADRLVGLAPEGARFLPAMGVVTLVFLSLRFFGQGCLALVSRVVIGVWFNRYRGRATAVAGVFTAFGFNSSPIGLNYLVTEFGWRETCLLLAAIIGLGVALVGWIIYRDSPESCGLRMDGAPEPPPDTPLPEPIVTIRHEFTRSEAARTLGFWAFSLALSSHGFLMTALTFHIAALGREMGLSQAEAFSVFWPMAFFGVAGNIIGGWVGDRTRLKYLLIAMMAAELMGSAGLYNLGEPHGRALLIAGYGTAGGLFANLVTVTWPRYFGRRHIGAVSGLNMSVMVFTSALGPVFFSAGEALTGSYRAVILAWMIVPACLLALGFWVRNPQERYAPPGGGAS